MVPVPAKTGLDDQEQHFTPESSIPQEGLPGNLHSISDAGDLR
jgi:hypothetical protein